METLLAATGAFILTHAIPALHPVRSALIRALGRRVYVVLYNAVSLGVVIWLIAAYRAAPMVPVWPSPPSTHWVPVLVMPLACVLLVAGLSSPNPLSITLARRPFDPARPGIVSVSRHPVMWALVLWAGAHIPPNGNAAGLVLFGLLLGLSLAGPFSLDAKARKRLGGEAWTRLGATSSSVPFAAVLAGRTRLDLAGIGPVRLAAGLALYATLLYAHPLLIGVSPLP